ncbi:proton-coupled zinc antiporter SLC30A2-like [Topomyia yanbarensis]|uniref:proton-coupled zinc antiporter SLC30A2-like n=1 Tax=Topomyia yanbarensis TaxID=2498891 RepID=UPI00273C82F1|nr:proton-coupled zinc antiporter SLC30A2-like [Topomyia yanbarensis]
MSVYLEVSTNCDDEMYENENGVINSSSQQNLLSLQSITSLSHPNCLFNHSPENSEPYGKTEKRKLLWAIAFTLVFMLAEFVGGYLSGSLAIMTDAAHLLSDCISFLIAVISIWISNKPPDGKMSFGYRRIEVIGALLSIFGIWALTIFLVVLSIQRLIADDFEIDADTMIIVAILGVVMNIATAFILHGSCSIVPHMHHGHSHGHTHEHAHSGLHPAPTLQVPASTPRSRSRSHSPRKKKPHPRLEKLKICDEKKCDNMEQLTIPNLPPSPTVSPYNSFPSSRHNSFTVNASTPRPSLESMLHSARTKLKTEALRQRSIDAAINSPDLISSSKFLYNKINTDNSSSLSPSRKESLDSNDSSSADEQCTNHSHHHHHHGEENLNVRAAIIHVIGDFIQSIGVLIAAIVIKYAPNLKVVDPICTFLFSIIVLITTVRIFRDSMRILLDAVPSSVAVDKLNTELECISGVKAVHDLNVWSISTGLNVMTVHLMVDPIANTAEILVAANTIAQSGFDISKCTVQIEKMTFCS